MVHSYEAGESNVTKRFLSQAKMHEPLLLAIKQYDDELSGPLLHSAVRLGDIEFVRDLCELGMDVDVLSELYGQTPLDIAIMGELSDDMLVALVEYGANIHASIERLALEKECDDDKGIFDTLDRVQKMVNENPVRFSLGSVDLCKGVNPLDRSQDSDMPQR